VEDFIRIEDGEIRIPIMPKNKNPWVWNILTALWSDPDAKDMAKQIESVIAIPVKDQVRVSSGFRKVKINDSLRLKIFERDGYTCKHCGKSKSLNQGVEN
jgi:hypothetical protein